MLLAVWAGGAGFLLERRPDNGVRLVAGSAARVGHGMGRGGDAEWTGLREETGNGAERSRVDCGLGFGPGWGICGVRLGRSDVAAASGPLDIWTRYGGAGQLGRLGWV